MRQTNGSSSVADTLRLLTGRPVNNKEMGIGGSFSGYYAKYWFDEMKKDLDSGNAIILERPFQKGNGWWSTSGGFVIDGTPDKERYTATVSKLYTDSEGNRWAELHYPGTRPHWLPENPVPFGELNELFKVAHNQSSRPQRYCSHRS